MNDELHVQKWRHDPVSGKMIFACPCGSLKVCFHYTYMCCLDCKRGSLPISAKTILDDPWVIMDLWNSYAQSAYHRPRAIKLRELKATP